MSNLPKDLLREYIKEQKFTSTDDILGDNFMSKEHFDKKEQERLNKQKQLNEFNSVTHSVKPVNQNQKHNIRIFPSFV